MEADETLPEESGRRSPTSDRRNMSSADVGDEKRFIVGWDDGDSDPMNPRSMSLTRKWLITAVIASSSICVTVNSTIYTFIYGQVVPEFHTNEEVATVGLTTFVLGLGVGPMLFAPLSEFYGRKPVYVSAFAIFFIWIIPCAVAQNAATLLVARFFDGFAGSVFLSVAGGTIGDMFAKQDLSFPMMVFSGSPFVGPALGPLIGGFINENTNWRWSFWVLLIWTGVQLILIATVIPETYHPAVLRKKAKNIRKKTGDNRFKAQIEVMDKSIVKTVLWSCIRPFQLLFLEPMCLNLCLLSAVLLGILYLFFGAFPLVFETNHGFSLQQVGMAFLGIFVGEMLAVLSDFIWSRNYTRLVRKREEVTGEPGVSEPEFRLPPTVWGSWICVLGLWLFAWTLYPFIPWAVPIVMSAFFGFGIIISFKGIFTYLVEAYPLYAASALAANSFARSIFAAVFPLFGRQMYENVGFEWATTILAFITMVLAPWPWVFYKYGRRIRKASRFANSDL